MIEMFQNLKNLISEKQMLRKTEMEYRKETGNYTKKDLLSQKLFTGLQLALAGVSLSVGTAILFTLFATHPVMSIMLSSISFSVTTFCKSCFDLYKKEYKDMKEKYNSRIHLDNIDDEEVEKDEKMGLFKKITKFIKNSKNKLVDESQDEQEEIFEEETEVERNLDLPDIEEKKSIRNFFSRFKKKINNDNNEEAIENTEEKKPNLFKRFLNKTKKLFKTINYDFVDETTEELDDEQENNNISNLNLEFIDGICNYKLRSGENVSYKYIPNMSIDQNEDLYEQNYIIDKDDEIGKAFLEIYLKKLTGEEVESSIITVNDEEKKLYTLRRK